MILAYLLCWLAVAFLYGHGRDVMISQEPSYIMDVGSFPVNGLLLFFGAGIAVDKLTKNRPKWVGWAVFAAVLSLLMLVFRILGGYRTVLG